MPRQLPRYRLEARNEREQDLNLLLNSPSLASLAEELFGTTPLDAISQPSLKTYFESDDFQKGADVNISSEMIGSLTRLVSKIGDTAIEMGFPGRAKEKGGRIDCELAIAMLDALSEEEFDVNPIDVNSRAVNQFFVLRLIPLILYWRWADDGTREEGTPAFTQARVTSINRNYFYTLWLSAWLLDQGPNSDDRWALLRSVTTDTLVQITERSGLGLRKEFAQAIVRRRLELSAKHESSTLQELTRGAMKRATFTLATCVMPPDRETLDILCRYLFDWAEEHYVGKR